MELSEQFSSLDLDEYSEDVIQKYEEYRQLHDFYETFSYNLIAVDPLDRELFDVEGNDRGTKIADLVTLVRNMTAAQG